MVLKLSSSYNQPLNDPGGRKLLRDVRSTTLLISMGVSSFPYSLPGLITMGGPSVLPSFISMGVSSVPA